MLGIMKQSGQEQQMTEIGDIAETRPIVEIICLNLVLKDASPEYW